MLDGLIFYCAAVHVSVLGEFFCGKTSGCLCSEGGPFMVPGKRFYFLDGLRGVASLLVVLFHFTQHTEFPFARVAYFCVDLFFAMSGFILAYTYAERIESGLSLRDFVVRRLVRLYPMFFIGMVIGSVFLFIESLSKKSTLSEVEVLYAFIYNIFYLPYLNIGSTYFFNGVIRGEIFPSNGPAWSLFFEISINFIFYYVVGSNIRKIFFIVVASFGLFAIFILLGEGGGGWGAHNLIIGAIRVCFGFFVGVLCYHIYLDNNKLSWLKQRVAGHPSLVAFAVTAVLIVCATYPFGLQRLVFLLLIALLPIIIFLSSIVSISSLNRVYSFFGDLSYPLYCIHFPVAHAFNVYINYYKIEINYNIVVIEVIVSIVFAYFLLIFYDSPVRKFVQTLLRNR